MGKNQDKNEAGRLGKRMSLSEKGYQETNDQRESNGHPQAVKRSVMKPAGTPRKQPGEKIQVRGTSPQDYQSIEQTGFLSRNNPPGIKKIK